MSRTIIQVVPQLPSPSEGVGSFALLLAGALRSRLVIESRFLSASPSSAWDEIPGGFRAERISRPDPGLLCESLEETGRNMGALSVLVHYANYAYEPRGCPSWLVEGLARWKARNSGRLVTVFHEIYAMGPPWRSSFWLSPQQRRLASSLARLSDGLAASMQLHRRILQRWVPEKEVAVLPVFSNVGEPLRSPALAERSPTLVIFGGAGTRAFSYRELRPVIEFACHTLRINEILDVGPGTGPQANLTVPVRRLGPLPEAEVSELLSGSLAGFLAYPASFLSKSGVFAAYCAHRILPICAWPWPRRRVEPFPPFWAPRPGAETGWDDLQSVANKAHAWYCGHSLDRHADSCRALLGL